MAAPSTSRNVFIGGNMKAAASNKILSAQIEVLNGMGAFPTNAEVVVAPSALHIGAATATLRKDVGVAIQDVHTAKVQGLGAFTGSHTVEQVKDFGLKWAIVGHSERRSLWGETDTQVGQKTKLLIESGIDAIVCIGETLAEREADRTLEVVFRQLTAVAAAISAAEWAHVVVAYEPVWAIGTGKVATAEQAQTVHAAIRGWLRDNVSAEVAEATRIIYGGSVTGANCVGLITQTDIDGFLVGGACLKPEFVDIINSAAKKVAA